MLHHSLTLDVNADSTECCPTPPLRHLLACGTYQLDEACKCRHGKLHLFSLHSQHHRQQGMQQDVLRSAEQPSVAAACQGSEAGAAAQPFIAWYRLQQQHTQEVPGILDMKWGTCCSTPPVNAHQVTMTPRMAMLGVALADGGLRLYRPKKKATTDEDLHSGQEQQGWWMEETAACQAVTAGLSLALDWAPSHFHPQLTGDIGEPDSEAASLSSQQQQQQQQEGETASTRARSLSSQGLIAISGSACTLALIQVLDRGLHKLAEWVAHDLEVWCVAFSRNQPWLLYSGADDCTLKAWDVRGCCTHFAAEARTSPARDISHEAKPSTPVDADAEAEADTSCNQAQCVFSDRKTHGAGVCTISPHWQQGLHVMATGSYDERVRLWDTQQPIRPKVIAEANTGGGNWRLRWHPHKPTLLLAACMYNGCAILQASDDFKQLQVIQVYTGHGSISYGADWFCRNATLDSELFMQATCKAAEKEEHTAELVATCSFYDRLLHLWSPHC